MMFESWLCARTPRLYRNVLSQRIEMSGLPVSMSNACAAPLAASIEATASDAARRRNRVPAAMGCFRYCILVLPLWLIDSAFVRNRDVARKRGQHCSAGSVHPVDFLPFPAL